MRSDMASLNFPNMKKTTIYSNTGYVFADLFLDMQEDYVSVSSNIKRTFSDSRDIKVAFDLNAIKNSLKNLFNTMKGERLLLPEYGCDLRQFVFDNITEANAKQIGLTIKKAIKDYEPRITLLGLNINAYPDTNEYVIDMTIAVPFLNEPLNLTTIFTRQGVVVQ